jgi:gentisate 1,2-dioxygenase
MLPLDYRPQPAEATRMFVYPYAQTIEALRGVASGPPDPHFGHALRFVNPATGASPMPTIGARAQSLPQGMQTRPRRSSDGTVFLCLEGEGTAAIGERSFEFSADDVFVVPSWSVLSIHARRDTVLFSFSDQPVQQVLGLWREERL